MKKNRQLIIHADDLGIDRAVNQACFLALEERWITSASAMVPAPYFAQVVEFAKNRHHQFDLGIHLTFTSEWPKRKLSPCAKPSLVKSLVDRNGHFHSTVDQFLRLANLDEIIIEANAQIKRALILGLKPTHLDCHMFSLYRNPKTRSIISSLSFQYNLPVLFPDGRIFAMPRATAAVDWEKSYIEMLLNLPAGISELIVHPGFDTPGLRNIMGIKSAWGSEWRRRDLEFVGSYFLPGFLKKMAIQPVDWKIIHK